MNTRSEEKFTHKSEWYDEYRPQYPKEIIGAISAAHKKGGSIADIGAGTGYLTLPLARLGFHMIAVEPNDELRDVLKRKAAHQSELRIEILEGRAQSTNLPDHSLDGIVMGNVAHWLDKKPEILAMSLREMWRITKAEAVISIAFTHPNIQNSWLPDIFSLVKEHDPSFDSSLISETFADPSRHAVSFLWDINAKDIVSFRRSLEKQGFVEFMCSHSFCNSDMSGELGTIFDQHSLNGSINVDFDSINFTGFLRKPEPQTLAL